VGLIDPTLSLVGGRGVVRGEYRYQTISSDADKIARHSADINRIATVYGVDNEPEESTPAVGCLVNHAAMLIVVDKDGKLKLILPFDLTEEQVAAVLARFVG
jgi:cytochrome oxidase Cu insertion factor (SCO1/SenC/PrrC family)